MAPTFETRAHRSRAHRAVRQAPAQLHEPGMVAELDELIAARATTARSARRAHRRRRGKFITHYDVEEILPARRAVGRRSAGVAGARFGPRAAFREYPGPRRARRTPAPGCRAARVHDLFLRMNAWTRSSSRRSTGPALGGGCELALACDMRYMAEAAAGSACRR